MRRRPSFSRSAPFQLRVLETALHMATQELAQTVKELLATADQPLQSLAATVSNHIGWSMTWTGQCGLSSRSPARMGRTRYGKRLGRA